MRPIHLLFAFLLLLPLAACSCEEEEPEGAPYHCGMGMPGATLCRVGQACIRAMGAREGFSCAREQGCPADFQTVYCGVGGGGGFCTAMQPFPLVDPPDGGMGTTMQSSVICQF